MINCNGGNVARGFAIANLAILTALIVSVSAAGQDYLGEALTRGWNSHIQDTLEDSFARGGKKAGGGWKGGSGGGAKQFGINAAKSAGAKVHSGRSYHSSGHESHHHQQRSPQHHSSPRHSYPSTHKPGHGPATIMERLIPSTILAGPQVPSETDQLIQESIESRKRTEDLLRKSNEEIGTTKELLENVDETLKKIDQMTPEQAKELKSKLEKLGLWDVPAHDPAKTDQERKEETFKKWREDYAQKRKDELQAEADRKEREEFDRQTERQMRLYRIAQKLEPVQDAWKQANDGLSQYLEKQLQQAREQQQRDLQRQAERAQLTQTKQDLEQAKQDLMSHPYYRQVKEAQERTRRLEQITNMSPDERRAVYGSDENWKEAIQRLPMSTPSSTSEEKVDFEMRKTKFDTQLQQYKQRLQDYRR